MIVRSGDCLQELLLLAGLVKLQPGIWHDMMAPNLSLSVLCEPAARGAATVYGGHMRTLGPVNTDVLEPADLDKNPGTMKIIAAVAASAAHTTCLYWVISKTQRARLSHWYNSWDVCLEIFYCFFRFCSIKQKYRELLGGQESQQGQTLLFSQWGVSINHL